jgi:hypothetical protein
MDHRDIGFRGVNWVHLAEDTDLWRALVKHSKEPLDSTKKQGIFLTSSKRTLLHGSYIVGLCFQILLPQSETTLDIRKRK